MYRTKCTTEIKRASRAPIAATKEDFKEDRNLRAEKDFQAM